MKIGIDRTAQRALLKSLGLTGSDISKPWVAVVNSYSEIVPGHIHLNDISEAVKTGVRSAGGMPFEFNTIAICDGICQGTVGMKYSLPSRDLITDTVEVMIQGHQFDAMVMISSCDKIVPGHLMAAATRYSNNSCDRRANGSGHLQRKEDHNNPNTRVFG